MKPKRRAPPKRIAAGDWQTPASLATLITSWLAQHGLQPSLVVEPTCGVGNFLAAARQQWPASMGLGYERNADYVRIAQERFAEYENIDVHTANFFACDWATIFQGLSSPILVLGNLPWVTNAELGALGIENTPMKSTPTNWRGWEAVTGSANFDISQAMLMQLLMALKGKSFRLVMLCKASVARKVAQQLFYQQYEARGAMYQIDARHYFSAAVEAVLLSIESGAHEADDGSWPYYPSLDAGVASKRFYFRGAEIVSDRHAYEETKYLAGGTQYNWRSGIKHDCAAVMELRYEDSTLSSRVTQQIELEPTYVYPLLKGSDVANQRWPPSRAVIVPHQKPGESTEKIASLAPKTWAYLQSHQQRFAARKSKIYATGSSFSVFAVGAYSFMPWKVAIAGFYKKLSFFLVGPHNGRPVFFDDTVYYVSFQSKREAELVYQALTSPAATAFFTARICWQDKRPITKKILQQLHIEQLIANLAAD